MTARLIPRPTLSFVIAAVLLAVLAPRFSGSAHADPYRSQYVADLPFVHLATSQLVRGSRTLEYTLSVQAREGTPIEELAKLYEPVIVHAQMTRVWALMEAFFEELGLPDVDCRSRFNLNIFIIARAQMFDEGRFLEYMRDANRMDIVIYAFYDTTPEVAGESAVILSSFDGKADEMSLAHEVAHYWFDRVCVSASTQESSELIATRFERYYRDRR